MFLIKIEKIKGILIDLKKFNKCFYCFVKSFLFLEILVMHPRPSSRNYGEFELYLTEKFGTI